MEEAITSDVINSRPLPQAAMRHCGRNIQCRRVSLRVPLVSVFKNQVPEVSTVFSIMPTTLVTGANAFVAAHIISRLVQAGHRVIGTVRRAAAGDEILALHPEWKSQLEIAVVEDIAVAASWDNLFQRTAFDHVSGTPDDAK